MQNFARLFLLLCSAGFILIGVNTFIDPLAALAPVGLAVNNVNALNELHATYGGMQIGIGLALLAALRSPALLRPVLLAQALIVGGLASGRLVSLVVDGTPENFMLGLLALEATITLLSLGFYLKTPRRD